MSSLVRSLVWRAVRRLATDPRLQRQAAAAYRHLRPRAEAMVRDLGRDLGRIARTTPPLRDPAGFARRLGEVLRRRR